MQFNVDLLLWLFVIDLHIAALGYVVFRLGRRVEPILRDLSNTQGTALNTQLEVTRSLAASYKDAFSSQQQAHIAQLEVGGAMHSGLAQVIERLSQTVTRDYGKQSLDLIRDLATVSLPHGDRLAPVSNIPQPPTPRKPAPNPIDVLDESMSDGLEMRDSIPVLEM